MKTKTLFVVEHDESEQLPDTVEIRVNTIFGYKLYLVRILPEPQPVADEQRELAALIERHQYGLQFGDGSLQRGRSLTSAEKRLVIDSLRNCAAAADSRPQGDTTIADYEEVLRDKQRLTKELDRLIDSTAGAENPSLCDVVGFVARKVRDAGGVSLIQQIEAATTAAHSVPDGYKPVPANPTEAMVEAARWAVKLGEDADGAPVYLSKDETLKAYKAMLNAAPPLRVRGVGNHEQAVHSAAEHR